MTTIQNANQRATGVTSEGRLQGEGIDRDYVLMSQVDDGWSFTAYDLTVTPTGAADVFFVLQNTSDYPVMLEELRFYDAHAGEFIHVQVGANYTITGGTTLEPVNRTAGSANLASSRCTIEAGANITGDSSSTIMQIVAANNTETLVSFRNAPIILGKGQCVNLEASGGASAIRYELDFTFLKASDFTDD